MLLVLGACASVYPKQATRVAQPDNGPIRNFTSFSASLRCMDTLLDAANRPRVLISSTGVPDLSKSVNVGADDMLVNAVSRMNRISQTYVFQDQSLEKDWGQIDLLTPIKDAIRPDFYVRAAITQVDKNVVNDTGSLSLDFSKATSPPERFGATFSRTKPTARRSVTVVTVDMHLVSYPNKTVVPGSSVANSMVVVSDSRGLTGSGLIKLTGFDFTLSISRVESVGQAVRNLVELGVIELFGRHARVPYWDCLNIRPTNQKLDNVDEVRFTSTPHHINVVRVQRLLHKQGYLEQTANGALDAPTRRAISRFQADNKLIATGQMDYHLYVHLLEKAGGFTANRALLRQEMPDPNAPAPALSLLPDKLRYRKGDTLGLRLTVGQDGYVTCYHQSGDGPIVQILPVQPGQLLTAQQGAVLSVPGDDANFDIKFESSGAEEAVMCVLNADRKNRGSLVMAANPLEPVQAKSFDEIVALYQRRRGKPAVARFRTRSN